MPRCESSLMGLIVREGYVRILIHGGRKIHRMSAVHRMGVRVSPVCHTRSWGHLVIITPFHRRSHIRGLCRSTGFGTGFTVIPSKLQLGLLLGSVERYGPTRTMAVRRGLRAAAGTIKFFSFPVARGPAFSAVPLFVTGDVLPNVT